MTRRDLPYMAAALALGLAGALFTLSISGEIPGLWGLAALASLPIGGLLLATWATGRGIRN